MSRTIKDQGFQYRILKNSLYKKYLHIWSDDLGHRKKDRTITRHLRRKLKREERKEVAMQLF